MKRKRTSKFAACLLSALVLLQTGYFSLTAFADRHNVSMYHDGFTWKTTINFTNPVNGHVDSFPAGDDMTRVWFKAIDSPAYCIEPGISISKGSFFNSGDTSYWNSFGRNKRSAVALALFYGFPNNSSLGVGQESGYAATQLIVWEYVLGYRNPATNVCSNKTFYNNINIPSKYSNFVSAYAKIDDTLRKYPVVPSFMSRYSGTAPIITLKYNPSTAQYEATVTDTNELATLPDMPLSANGVTFTKINNKTLKITSKNTISETAPVNVTSNKALPSGSAAAPVVWSASGLQTLMTSYGRPDPVPGYMRIVTESVGNLKIVKSAEDGAVSGKSFRVTGNGVDKTVSTASNGTVTVTNLNAGSYTVQEVSTPAQYNQPATQTIVVNPGQTTTANFSNTLKKGRVSFVKKDSYSGGYLSGAKYRIYRSDGTYVTEMTSNASQWIYSPYLPYGSYYLQESQAPQYFALDGTKYPFTISSNDQVISTTVSDAPLSDVYPTFVEPNVTTYRAGTQIIASYLIHNNSVAEHATDRPLTVHFTAYYLNSSGVKVNITTQQNNVVAPRGDQNLTYFKVSIPSGVTNIHFTCSVDTPAGVVETNTANNTDSQTKNVSSVVPSATPNTKFENTPTYFNRPDDSAAVPTGAYATNVTPSATWQQWVYAAGTWTKKTYGLTLAADQQLLPDVNSLSHDQENGLWHMRSGYGVSLTANSKVTAYDGAELPGASAYILPQNGNSYFPEFDFDLSNGRYRTLQLTAADTLQFEPNPYSITKQGVKDGRRIHFTPLWYPDGNYIVKTYLYDAWTPAGMVSLQSTLQPVVIGGSIYDDWYINHT